MPHHLMRTSASVNVNSNLFRYLAMLTILATKTIRNYASVVLNQSLYFV